MTLPFFSAYSIASIPRFSLPHRDDTVSGWICNATIAEYDRIYKKLIRFADLYDVSSSLSMEQLKYTTEIPLPAGETLGVQKSRRS